LEFAIRDIVEANLADIPESCKGCLYWEFPEEFDRAREEGTRSEKRLEFEQKKRVWFLRTLREFGTCGKIVYCDDKPVGYAQFAPSERLPNTDNYESHPVGRSDERVVFLSCLYVAEEELRRKGLGKKLLRSVIDDLRRRGFNGVETFARRGSYDNPSGPLEFYIKNGFAVKDQTNPEFPLVRLTF
jgi:GNAT superfamily N-acetyltransferase